MPSPLGLAQHCFLTRCVINVDVQQTIQTQNVQALLVQNYLRGSLFALSHGIVESDPWDIGQAAPRRTEINTAWGELLFFIHPSKRKKLSKSPWEGLLHLPSKWWLEVQRVVFAGTCPEVSWCETSGPLDAGKYSLSILFQPAINRSKKPVCNQSQVKISESRALDLLANYLAKGTVFFLANVAKKYMMT